MAESLGVKNARWDRKDGYVVPRNCYNSYFYIVEEPMNIIDKFLIHGKDFTGSCDGGSAAHINLEEHLTKSQYKKLLEVAIQADTPYFTFNIPNTVCNKCGYVTKDYRKTCPSCGSDDIDYLTRVIGYLRRVSNFSAERQDEESMRYYAKI
jgi:anaerobic ribonucleoside-triphosphate reductase